MEGGALEVTSSRGALSELHLPKGTDSLPSFESEIDEQILTQGSRSSLASWLVAATQTIPKVPAIDRKKYQQLRPHPYLPWELFAISDLPSISGPPSNPRWCL
jgi:wyosine [tRNA(Phe)-imidazoG37] synthetase (radical SAM superfamily)